MRILAVCARPIWPPRDGGIVREYNLIRELSQRARVTVLSLNLGPEPAPEPEALLQSLEHYESFHWPRSKIAKFPILASTYLLSCAPFAPMQFRVRQFVDLIARTIQQGEFDIVQINGILASACIPPALLTGGRNPCLVVDAMDVEARRMARNSRVAASPLARLFYAAEAHRMRRWERRILHQCDGITGVSPDDLAVFREIAPGVPQVLGPNGADLEHYRITDETRVSGLMLYVGSMDYVPNMDAVHWFGAEIMPLIRQQEPDAHLDIVGRRGESLGDDIVRLGGVRVLGMVPDVQPHYAGCGVFVVPLRSGGGTRLKIAEALACGCPVVSTSMGAEGLPVVDGEHLLIADTPEDFAHAVVSLMRDPQRAAALGRRGSELVRRELGWDSVADRMRAFYETLVEQRRRVTTSSRRLPESAEPSAPR